MLGPAACWLERGAGRVTILVVVEVGRMVSKKSEAPVELRDQQWDAVRALVRGLEEERDLQGLAALAEMGLMGLRQLCERPITCEDLDRLLETLRGLNLDAWEMGEEQ